MPNRLAGESSPYLLQHAHNPVDWYPWGAEALERAANDDRPIFLSIGYSACHWCHVMERESFEDETIAAFLNDNFVCIKVDREERPDLDQIYMQAVMAINGGAGGWPLSAFLTPRQELFFGGTYWPPHASRGMPGFDHVLSQVARAYSENRSNVEEQAGKLTEYLSSMGELGEPSSFDHALLHEASEMLQRSFDREYGGFGNAPKFPHTMDLQLLAHLLSRWSDDAPLAIPQLDEVMNCTLTRMAQGGIYDHLGGGFARYSVDRQWLVPHFEKMLYDNALLVRVYLEAYIRYQEPLYRQVVTETLDYVRRDLTDPEGGFHSTEDADSEGVEGKFYVWTPAEIEQVLGTERGIRFCRVYGVTETGNFEERQSILNLTRPLDAWAIEFDLDSDAWANESAQSRQALFDRRCERVRPGKDDKVLVGWNGLMIDAMARAGALLGQDHYLQAARSAAEFVVEQLRDSDGRLFHAWRKMAVKQDGASSAAIRQESFLDDYASMINALVTLYESDFDERWIDRGVELADRMLDQYYDSAGGAFFYTSSDHEQLIARQKDWQDSSTPSGNALAAYALVRLGQLTTRSEFLDAARSTAEALSSRLRQAPQAGGQMMMAMHLMLEPFDQFVLVADQWDDELQAVERTLQQLPSGNRVLLRRVQSQTEKRSAALDPLFRDRPAIDGRVTLYHCTDAGCRPPIHGAAAITASLQNQIKSAEASPNGESESLRQS